MLLYRRHFFYYDKSWNGHGRLSFNTETLLYVVSPYDYYYYVKCLTTYFTHLDFKIGFDLFLNLILAKFLCIITTYHIIKHFELL